MNLDLIALAVGFFILPLIVGGGMLFNGMRNDRRLATRFADLHRPARSLVVTQPNTADNLRTIATQVVGAIGEDRAAPRPAVRPHPPGCGDSIAQRGPNRKFQTSPVRRCENLLILVLPGAMWIVTDSMDVSSTTQMVASAGVAIVGLLSPDSVVKKLRDRHVQRIQDELPDALDMMVICAQAGLGLGTTVVRVSHELRMTHAPSPWNWRNWRMKCR